MLIDRTSRPRAASHPGAGAVIAGWRLVRPLTPDGQEFVGVAEFASTVVETGSEHWAGFSTSAKPRLQLRRIVLASGPDACACLAKECALRDEVGSEFVELAQETLAEGECRIAIFPLRPVRGWTEIVASGVPLAPGQLVTALVPIVETIQHAHRNGIAHTSVSLGACRIDDEGRPSLDDWSSAVRLEGLAAVKADIARGNDLRALGRICDSMLALSNSAPSDHLRQLVDALCDGVTPSDAAGRLVDSLFQWSEPAALPEAVLPQQGLSSSGGSDSAQSDSAGSESELPASRSFVFGYADAGDSHAGDEPGSAPAIDRLLAASFPPEHTDRQDEHGESLLPSRPRPRRRRAIAHLSEQVARWAAAAATVRPAIWAALAIAGAIALIGGAVLIAVGSDSRASDPGATHSAGTPGETSSSMQVDGHQSAGGSTPAESTGYAVDDDAEAASGESIGGSSASAPDSSGASVPENTVPENTVPENTVPENAVPENAVPETAADAVPRLLAARNECIRAADAECLTALYSGSAPGLAADLDLLTTGDSTRGLLQLDQEWVLAADLGDIELFNGGETASLAVERTSAGWYLRDIWLPETSP